MILRNLAVCSMLLAAGAFAPAQQEHAWKWKEKDEFWVLTTTQVKQLVVLEDPRGDVVRSPDRYRAIVGLAAAGVVPRRVDNDREVRADYTQLSLLLYSVKKVNADGSAVVTQKLERSEYRAKKKDPVPAQPAAGGAPQPPPKVTEIRKEDPLLRNMELTLHCTRHGVVTKVEGHQKLLERLTDGAENREEVLRDILSEESLKKSATQSLGFLPDKRAVPGLTWERPADLNLGPLGKLTVVHTYRLEGIDGERAIIKTSSRVTRYAPGAAALSFQVTAGDFSTAENAGTLRFDPAAGRLVEAESKIILNGALTLKNGDDTYRARLTQEQAVTSQVFDKKPSQ